MILAEFFNNLAAQHRRLEPKINSVANHLIVIYAFALPVLIQVRRASLFLLLLLFIFRGHYYKYFSTALRDPLIRAFAIYFIIHVVWLIGYDGSPYTKQIVHDSAFMLYPLLFFTFIDQRYIKRILFAFVIGMIFSELVSYALSLQLFNPDNIEGINGKYHSPAPVYGRTHYGFMLATFIVALFIILRHENLDKVVQVLLSIILITCTVNIFLAGGRTGPILLGILVLSYIILHLRKKQTLYTFAATIFVIAIFSSAYFFSTTFNTRVNQTIDSIVLMDSKGEYATNLGYRVAIIKNSGEILRENWLFGLGTGDHIPQIQEIVSQNNPDIQVKLIPIQNMHNEYLGALTQFGIIGLLAFINILYQLFKYQSNFFLTRELLPLLAIAMSLFTLVDIFTIGLGALLVTVFYVSIGLNNYVTKNAYFKQLDGKQLSAYAILVIIFQSLSYL
jgi:O-antigen ligase